jgi:hypothetical protein
LVPSLIIFLFDPLLYSWIRFADNTLLVAIPFSGLQLTADLIYFCPAIASWQVVAFVEAAMSGGRGWLQVLVFVCCPGQLVVSDLLGTNYVGLLAK